MQVSEQDSGNQDPNKTIISESAVGQRLSRVRAPVTMYIVCQGKRIPLTSRITVGRDPANTIELKDALVSRHHALIQKVKDDFFVKDLNSTNGTLVNAQPVPPGKYVRLRASDVIRIGRTDLSLRLFQDSRPGEGGHSP